MKTDLDLSDIIVAPEYRQTITIIRDTGGSWYQGKYIKTTETINTSGVVSATDEREIQYLPEGDRAGEVKTVHITIPVYTTRGGSIGRDADRVIWNGETYKVVKVQNSGDYGYYRCLISKVGTEENISNG